MEIDTIQGETRNPAGRHANDRLRRRGMLPAIIYGHGQPAQMVSLSRRDTQLALEHQIRVIKLQINGQEEQYLIKDVQYDHLQKEPLHVDLMRVDVTERVQVKVAIELRGTPAGAAKGGTLVHVITDLEIECLLLKIPEGVRARVDHLHLNEALHVRDIELPPDVKVLHEPEDIVAVVHPPRGKVDEDEETETPAEDGTEPEIIGKGPKEDAPGAGGD